MNITSPTLKRWRFSSGGPSPPDPSSSSRTSRGSCTPTKTVPTSTNRAPTQTRKARGIVEKTCHISVLMNSTRANTSSSGTARDSTETDASSWSISRGPVQRRIDSTP